MEGESEAEEMHPLVHLGEVFWNGQDPLTTLQAGGLRSDVWRHVGTFKSGVVYNPSTMKDMYLRLSRIRSVDRVQMSTDLRWDTLVQKDGSLRRSSVLEHGTRGGILMIPMNKVAKDAKDTYELRERVRVSKPVH